VAGDGAGHLEARGGVGIGLGMNEHGLVGHRDLPEIGIAR
jgi:hypothetical protein